MNKSVVFFFSSRRRHTRWPRDWSSDVCSSDLRRPRCPRRRQEGRGGEDGASPERSNVGRVGPDTAPRRVPPGAGEAARLQAQVRGQDGGARPGPGGQGRGPDGSPSQEYRSPGGRPGQGKEKRNQGSRLRSQIARESEVDRTSEA